MIDFVLSHPCRGRPAFPGQDSNIDASHSIVNLGHLWSCSRCKASYSVRVPARGRLAKKCSGGSAKKAQPVAKPTETAAKGFSALFSGLKLSSASAEMVNPRPSQGPAVAPQARVPQPKAPGPSGFAALFSVGSSLANAPVSFLPGDDLGSVTGPEDPPVTCAIATELGTPSARGPPPPFSSREAVAQALPKAIPNQVQALSSGISPTLPALPKAKAMTANARGAPLARDSQPNVAEDPTARTPAKSNAPRKRAKSKAKEGNAQSSGTQSVLHFFKGCQSSQ